jgi:hypothetical protein
MRRVLATTAGLFFLIGATVAKPAETKTDKSDQVLVEGMHAVAQAASSESKGPPPKTKDNDQGDEHASDRAIFRVCNKDTPAARRSAICNGQVSPD